jgi:hypothetical protein
MIKARLVPTAAEGASGREQVSSARATDQPASIQTAHTEEDARSQQVVLGLLIGDWSLLIYHLPLVIALSSLVIRKLLPIIS